MKTLTSHILSGLLCAVALLPAAQAQTSYPNRPIELIVGHAAGGGSDVLGRDFALAAAKHLSQPIIVMNKPGATGVIASTEVMNGRPDGYKLLMLDVNAVIMPNMGLTKITHEEFIPIARLNFDPSAITVRGDSPWNTLEEFLAAAKKGDLRVGNGGNGSIWHLAAAGVEDKAGVKFNHIPFNGAAPAILSLMGGHIDAIAVSAAEVSTHTATGKLKILAVMSDQRIKGFEKVPTLKERKIDFSLGAWRGLAVVKGTPADVVNALRAATAKIMTEQSLRDAMDRQNMGYAYADADVFGAAVAKDHAFYKGLINKLGLKQ